MDFYIFLFDFISPCEIFFPLASRGDSSKYIYQIFGSIGVVSVPAVCEYVEGGGVICLGIFGAVGGSRWPYITVSWVVVIVTVRWEETLPNPPLVAQTTVIRTLQGEKVTSYHGKWADVGNHGQFHGY